MTKQEPNTEPQQTMGATMNNESTTTEPPPKNGQQPKPLVGGGVKCILQAPNLLLDKLCYWRQLFHLNNTVSGSNYAYLELSCPRDVRAIADWLHLKIKPSIALLNE